MAEQIKFEMGSDKALDILKDFGDAENDLGKELWKHGSPILNGKKEKRMQLIHLANVNNTRKE